MAKTRHVLLGVTGSIAAYKAADIVRRLRDRGCEVSVIMTPCAEKFITRLTLETLSGRPVSVEMFSRESEWDMAHIALAKWADVYLVAPATANVIGKLAQGIADDLVTCTAITTRAPVVVAPAMNTGMYTHGIVQENMGKLKKHGVRFIDPKEGKLACGDTGTGALADVDDIIKAVDVLLK
jgi:phosphopantothenoylcysteine decarboxylase/phosphopantothenate--cysteine ligase